jgi:hypothetical protein
MRPLVVLLLLAALLAAGCLNGGTGSPAAQNATNNSSGNMTATPPASQAPTEETVTVPAGHAKLNLTVTFSPSSGAPVPVAGRPPVGVANGIDVKLGALDCPLPDGPVQGRTVCTKTGDLPAGALKLTFAGEGDVSARVVVTAS